ncbi:MAG: hypothetical protein U0Y10_23735 [Spirosomataceae bacterium]
MHFLRSMVMLTALFQLLSCAKPIANESDRFGDNAPVVDSLAMPAVHKWEMPFKKINDYVDSLHLLPIQNDYYNSIIFYTFDDRRIYASVSPSKELEKQFPDRAAKRKPYLGFSAFDRQTGKLIWHHHIDDPKLWEKEGYDTTRWTNMGVPYLIDNRLVFTNYQQNGLYHFHIIDTPTGNILASSEYVGGFSYENVEYPLIYKDSTEVVRLDVGTNTFKWTYKFRQDYASMRRLEYLCDKDLLVCLYQNSEVLEWEVIDANTGKVVTKITVPKNQLATGVRLKLKGYAAGVAYFLCESCTTPAAYDMVRNIHCVEHDVAYDVQKQQVIKRTAYRE